MNPAFVHLHVHSEFSLVDSTIRIPEKLDYVRPDKAPRPNLLSRAVELRLPALALTDSNNLFAMVRFYRAAEAAGIKPIIGADVAIRDHDPRSGASRLGSCTLLVTDRKSFRNLSKLLTRAYCEATPGSGVAVEPDWLVEHGGGLIALAGCRSPLGHAALAGQDRSINAMLETLRRSFGDRLYLELSRTGRADEQAFEPRALELARAADLPVVASNDVRFLDADDFEAHEARVCIASSQTLNDPRRVVAYSEAQWLKPEADMVTQFADLPLAVAQSVEIAISCNLEMRFGTYHLPAFPVPTNETLEHWLASQSANGLAKRLERHGTAAGKSREDYDARLAAELRVISQMGFEGYFLIVADFIGWAKAQGIPVGPGRGSGAGSLVAWALGITDLDPLAWDLLFERFLNPERVSMPDFDIDFCVEGRDRVIQYVSQRYGHDRVSQIITYGTMAAKAVVRDSGRVLGHSYGFVDSVAKLVPNRLGVHLADALMETARAAEDPSFGSPELVRRVQAEPEVASIIDLARQLEDLKRNAGRHAGGVVIAPEPLTEFSPLYVEEGSSPVTQFDKDDVEAVGLVKFDFLGLKTLTVIDWTLAAVARRHPDAAPIDLESLPLDDLATYALLSRGEASAVFQFESAGMRQYLKQLEPSTFDDLIAMVALYRPGPMSLIPEFIERRHGRAEVTWLDPRMEPILKSTYGIMVYQEQVMQIAQSLGGYSLGAADLLRRAMGKKKPEEMALQRQIFVSGAIQRDIARDTAGEIFDHMERFAGYGFNKSHAAAYALVAYQTAWLKAHYPAEFMAAVLSADMAHVEKIVKMLGEVRQLGIECRPPAINASAYRFEVEADGRIRYGLGGIRGVGRGVAEQIVVCRSEGGPFRDLSDLCERVSQMRGNRRTIDALLAAGALDELGINRASLEAAIVPTLKECERRDAERQSGQVSMFGAAEPTAPAAMPVSDERALPEWDFEDLLARERAVLGHYLSGHPLDGHRTVLNRFATGRLADLDAAAKSKGPPAPVLIGVMVADVRHFGNRLLLMIEDGQRVVEASLPAEAQGAGTLSFQRDRIFVVAMKPASSRERERGFDTARIQRIWDFEALVARHIPALELRLDDPEGDVSAAVQALLDAAGPGPTRLHIRLRRPAGLIELRAGRSGAVRLDPTLLRRLASIDGVTGLRLRVDPSWLASEAEAAPERPPREYISETHN